LGFHRAAVKVDAALKTKLVFDGSIDILPPREARASERKKTKIYL
jgi:hypothetical protein